MVEFVHEISISQINTDWEWNCRSEMDDESVRSLANSIDTLGVETPLVVRESGGGRYDLICGFRRFKACTLLGHEFVPAFVREYDDEEARYANFRENVEREDLTFWDEVTFIKEVFSPEVKIGKIQEVLNRTYEWVRPRRQIWTLPQALINLAKQGVYNATQILSLLKRNPAEQSKAAKAAQAAVNRGESDKNTRKATESSRRRPQGRINIGRMMTILEQNSLVDDPKVFDLLLWSMGDLDKEALSERLGVDILTFEAIEE